MLHIQPLPEHLLKVAREELGEVPERMADDLQALKTWIHQQPHLKACADEQFLIQFLRGCKYSLERAKEKLDMFYTMKTKYPELFVLTDIENKRFQEMLKLGCFTVLPQPLNDCGPRIVLHRVNYNLKIQQMHDIILALCTLHELMMLDDPYACINGIVYIADMAKSTSDIVRAITPSDLKKSVTYVEKCLPLRIKLVCLLNLSPPIEIILKMLQPMLSAKLRQRFVFCGKSVSNVTEHIPMKYLPRDYGGENGLLDDVVAKHNKVWFKYREYFQQNANYGTDENLRPGKPIDFDGLFGMGGSFRKLEVD